MKIFLKRYIRYPFEFILFLLFYLIFKLLPLSVARKLGVSITTSFGPLFSINKLVKKNLRIAFKEKDEKWINIKTKKPEFKKWKWTSSKKMMELIVPFKKKLYSDVVSEMAEELNKNN